MLALSKDGIFYVNIVKFGLSIVVYFMVGQYMTLQRQVDRRGAPADAFARMIYVYSATPANGKIALWASVLSVVLIFALHFMIR
ncbi:MAG: hypothetical protein HY894_01900 [Deltaproteobacteria bacterium]|nr:hypothetical protein [Deltaproteobacteria bacterium]